MMIVPVILSGGSGTRLWPLSTPERPKQFLPLTTNRTMFAETLARVADRSRFAAPVVVCGESHVAHVSADLALLGIWDATVIVEPAARNTAPAIALAALAVAQDACLLVMPSDHAIARPDAFLDAVTAGYPLVAAGHLATFGIEPASPETGYGYIAAGAPMGDGGVRAVRRFVEKPAREAAQVMIDTGGHYWNAGIFLMRADSYLGSLKTHAPQIEDTCRKAMQAATTAAGALHPDAATFAACPSDSIDYAVMENAEDVIVVPVDPGWSDVGSWAALHAIAPKDEAGNVVRGAVTLVDCTNCFVRNETGEMLSLLGLSDMAVIAAEAGRVILPLARTQEVKRFAS
jgi:mannose-1-phosphate guanylyltransferase/mannose-1-phosphate guanylyltransferase/mannose-6-phosphate isomerase